jgi:hypothetical protein
MKDPLERERQLQDEAAAVLADLELLPLLQQLGRPVQVGSVPLGLMVAHDIDLTVLCSELDQAASSTSSISNRCRGG